MTDEPRSVNANIRINEEIAAMPLPSSGEVRRRGSLPRQFARFVVLNLKILKLSRQHH